MIAGVGRADHAFRILGAHTDSPSFKLKPKPTTGTHGWLQAGVEVYGGPLLNSWLDRELELAGRLVTRDGTEHLVRTGPLLRIPQLAIHLDREVNDGLTLDKQRHMNPVYGLGDPAGRGLVGMLADGSPAPTSTRRRSAATTSSPPTPRRPAGSGATARSSPPAGWTTSRPHAGLAALLAPPTAAAGGRTDRRARRVRPRGDRLRVPVGGGGPVPRGRPDAHLRRARRHGEPAPAGLRRRRSACRPTPATPCTRTTPSGTTRRTVRSLERRPAAQDQRQPALRHRRHRRRALGRGCAREAGVPYQEFVSNNAMPCGSTIGPLTATRLGIRTVDVGVPLLSMHSARELCGVDDPYRLAKVTELFFRTPA